MKFDYQILKNSDPAKCGFATAIDMDGNLSMIKELKEYSQVLNFPYSRTTNEIFSLSCSIVFKELQEKYSEALK